MQFKLMENWVTIRKVEIFTSVAAALKLAFQKIERQSLFCILYLILVSFCNHHNERVC